VRGIVVDPHLSRLCWGTTPRVLLNFQHYDHTWTVYFVEADCRTRVGPRTRYFNFPSLKALRSFVTRCKPGNETLARFERSVRAWGWGSGCPCAIKLRTNGPLWLVSALR
jgi:hypothetical protein